MKVERRNRFAAFALAVMFGCFAQLAATSSRAEDNRVSYKKLSYSFYGIQFLDAQNGWICGKSGYLFRTNGHDAQQKPPE